MLLMLLSGLATAVAGASLNISVVGNPVDVWASIDTLHKCHTVDVPDIPARAYVDDKNATHMIEGSTKFHRMTGPTVLNVTRNCSVSWNMTGNPDPAMFAADEFLDSPVVFPNGTVVVLVHTEFPGNRFDQCDGPAYPHCWTVTIGLAVSHDWGTTWNHIRPPPHHLVAAVPYKYNQTQLASGWGDPSNIVKSPKDGYYYVAMWNRNWVGLQEPGICIMRTNDLMDPTSWRGWDGKHFAVTFKSPYGMSPSEESEHICKVVNLPSPNCAAHGLVWSVFLHKFVVTMGCPAAAGGTGFYLATSDDLVHWSEAWEFYSRGDMPPDVQRVTRQTNYPTFIDPTAPTTFGDMNFYTIGRDPYLYWVSLGHNVYSDGRHLWATPMRFSYGSHTVAIEGPVTGRSVRKV